MKKILGLLIVVGIAAGLIFLSRNYIKTYTASGTVNCPLDAANRLFLNGDQRAKWLPGTNVTDSSFEWEGKKYVMQKILLNGFYAIDLNDKNIIEFSFTPALNNQTQFNVMVTEGNPGNFFSRIVKAITKPVVKTAEGFLNNLNSFFGETKNIYGIDISRGRVDNINWVSAMQDFDHFPATSEVYTVIDTLEKFLTAQQVTVLGQPILHIRPIDEKIYQMMTAVPVEKPIEPNNQFKNKTMAPGFLMKADVTGGWSRVTEAEREMENYLRDNHKQSPAIPFQQLITDRRKQTDSTKWVTQINYPVFN
ncbi:MAG: hypothetical protein IM558_04795 [Chitinophagaceae bacterium]|nr:hypothetical protein [Chitinophagaceae bacterium]